MSPGDVLTIVGRVLPLVFKWIEIALADDSDEEKEREAMFATAEAIAREALIRKFRNKP